jgi:hypothetical protein
MHAHAKQVAGAPRILGLTLNRPGSLLLALCSDRVIRLFEVAKQRQPPAALHSADSVRRALAVNWVRGSTQQHELQALQSHHRAEGRQNASGGRPALGMMDIQTSMLSLDHSTTTGQ